MGSCVAVDGLGGVFLWGVIGCGEVGGLCEALGWCGDCRVRRGRVFLMMRL